jgi:hypothetical protein
MADPTEIVNKLRSTIAGARKKLLGSATQQPLRQSSVMGYPMDILQETSEVNRAVKFTAYKYMWGSTVGNQEMQVKETNTLQFSCFLPIPPISEVDSHGYEKFDAWGTGQIQGGQIKEAMSKGAEALNGAMKGDFSNVGGALSASGQVLTPIVAKGAVKMLQGTMGEDWNVLRRNGANGLTINPLSTVIYQNTALRNFSFTYTMIARNPAESEIIDSIVRNFQYWARPSRSKLSADNVLGTSIDISLETLEHPSVWRIEFVGEGTDENSSISRWLPKIKTCVLSDVSVSYGGSENGAPLFFRSTGAPVVYTLDLSFQELYMNTAEDVNLRV